MNFWVPQDDGGGFGMTESGGACGIQLTAVYLKHIQAIKLFGYSIQWNFYILSDRGQAVRRYPLPRRDQGPIVGERSATSEST